MLSEKFRPKSFDELSASRSSMKSRKRAKIRGCSMVAGKLAPSHRLSSSIRSAFMFPAEQRSYGPFGQIVRARANDSSEHDRISRAMQTRRPGPPD